MGKKPLAGLVGLVTAGMLVTAGCGDCCHKNTRPSGDNYKPAPTFPAKNEKADKGAFRDPAADKQASPPAPEKPLIETPAPLPTDTKMGPQAGLTPPNGAAPMGVQTLKQEGFDNRSMDAGLGRSPSALAVPPTPQRPRTNDVQPASLERLPGAPNSAPVSTENSVPLPPITDGPQAPPRPASTLTPQPPPMPTGNTSMPGPASMSSGPPQMQLSR